MRNVNSPHSQPSFHSSHLTAPIHSSHYKTPVRSYNAINGVPSCANPWLLRQTLRGAWNFSG